MKARKPISRLTKPKVLRGMSRPALRSLLEPHAEFLASQQLDLPPLEKKRGNYNFNELAQALGFAPNRPEVLVQAFDQIGTLSDPHGAEILQRQLERGGVPIPPDCSNQDLAAVTFLTQPDLFSVALQQKRLVDTRKFRCFRARCGVDLSRPRTDDHTLTTMEETLSDWFQNRRRGAGCEIIPAEPVDGCVWFIIIHGGPRRRAATFQNRVKSVVDFHPEQDDVLRIDIENRRLWIHAKSAAEVDLYRTKLGQLIFGDPNAFEKELNLYTLEPLRLLGRAALRTDDIEGCPIRSIEVREMFIAVDPDNGTVARLSSQNDLFASIEAGSVIVPNGGFVKSAKFAVEFPDRREKARVEIALPATAGYENDGHSEWIEAWLKKRDFWIPEEGVIEDTVEIPADSDGPLVPAL